jgi:hypothetical protein
MELFLPSLFVVVIAALLAFVIIPRMGSMILAITSLIALVLAGIHHYNLFYAEYQLSTWQNGIGANAPFFILGLALLFIIGSIFFIFTGSAPVTLAKVANMLPESSPLEELTERVEKSVTNMPPANTATNIITKSLNNGIRSVFSGPTNNSFNRPVAKSNNYSKPTSFMTPNI